MASVLGISSKNGKPVELSLTDFLGAEKIDLTGKSYGLYNAKRIISFDLTVSKEKEMAITESSDSEFLNSKQKNLIASCKPYDLILFENIKAVSAEGKIINLNSISFSVK